MDAINTQNVAGAVDADLDLLLADLDVDDAAGDIEAVTDLDETVMDAVPEQTEIERVIEEEIVPDMIEASETEVQAEVEAMETKSDEVEVQDDGQAEENNWAGDADQGDATITVASTEHDEDALDAAAAEIEVEEERDAIYAEQPADETNLDATADTAAPAKPKKARAASTGTPKARTAVTDLPEDAFVLTTDIPADLAANKAAVLAACPAQKKVREKIENLLVSAAGGRAPSTYTQICFKGLAASKTGEITGSELTAALIASGLGEGTARSQSGQLMALFPAVKIATRTGNKLTLNPDSMLVTALKGTLGIA